MNLFVQVVFWLCVVGIITPYLVYPAWLFLLSRFRTPRSETSGPVSVSFVISVFNEAEVIREKLNNSLALNYPKDLLEIVVISDESDDGTDEIVKEFSNVRLIRQSPRQGKSAGITAAFEELSGELIVFSDANAIYQADAIGHLTKHFADPKVGYVVGRQMYGQSDGQAEQSESTYWDFELTLKAWESRLSSVVGGDGAIMAIRRDLFTPLKADDINDFIIPLRIVAAGYRGRFEPQAVCYEEAAPSFAGEFRRKVRIVNRSIRAVSRVPQSLNPFVVGIFAAQLFCHKVIRWFALFLMIGAFLGSGYLAVSGSRLYQLAFVAQASFYLLAVLAQLTAIRSFRPVTLVFYFCLANLAGGIGVMNFLIGKKFVTWTPQRTQTGSETSNCS